MIFTVYYVYIYDIILIINVILNLRTSSSYIIYMSDLNRHVGLFRKHNGKYKEIIYNENYLA